MDLSRTLQTVCQKAYLFMKTFNYTSSYSLHSLLSSQKFQGISMWFKWQTPEETVQPRDEAVVKYICET